MRLETNEAWIISKVFGEIDIFIYSPLFKPEAFQKGKKASTLPVGIGRTPKTPQ
jgi:hypothetical protein